MIKKEFCTKKKTIILLILWNILCILSLAVTLIAMKREVAAKSRFSVERMSRPDNG